MLKVLFYTLPGQLTVFSLLSMLFMMGYLIYYVMSKMKEESVVKASINSPKEK